MGQEVIGFFLIILGLILVLVSAPAMQQSVDTKTGSALENETLAIKNIYNVYQYIIPLLGIIVLIMGALMVWKG